MRRLGRRDFISHCFGLLAAGVVRPATAQQGGREDASIWWRGDYNASRRESSDTRRPLALVFMTGTCPWCRVMDRTTFRDTDVIDMMNRKFVPLRVDAEEVRHRFLVDGLGVRGLPATVVASHSGRLVNSHEGYLDPLMYLGFLNRSIIFGAGEGRPAPDGRRSVAGR